MVCARHAEVLGGLQSATRRAACPRNGVGRLSSGALMTMVVEQVLGLCGWAVCESGCMGVRLTRRVCTRPQTKTLGRLPVVNFAAGGVFKSGDPAARARAIVQAVTHYSDPKKLAEVSCGLGEPMVGIDCRDKNFNSYAARSE